MVPLQSIRESASTEDYMLNKLLILAVEVNRRKVRKMGTDVLLFIVCGQETDVQQDCQKLLRS